jgi:hypothetical protein
VKKRQLADEHRKKAEKARERAAERHREIQERIAQIKLRRVISLIPVLDDEL